MNISLIKSQFPHISEKNWTFLAHWADLMRGWNSKVNLISRKDIDFLEERHLAHCLSITNFIQFKPKTTILDVGTGGGLPGIPLAICFSDVKFTLIDSIGKKIRAVEAIIQELGLKNVKIRQIRAEMLKTRHDFILGRAVKNLPEFMGWIQGKINEKSLNSIKNGVIYLKGGDLSQELDILGYSPSKVVNLEESLKSPYFKEKFILYFSKNSIL